LRWRRGRRDLAITPTKEQIVNRTTRIAMAVASVVGLAAFGTVAGSSASGQDAIPSADSATSAASGSAPRAIITDKVEDVYVPVTPCRIVDGREALGVIPAGGNRSYEVRDTSGFVPQGGKSGGCGIPKSANAVTFTVTVVSPAGGGFLRAWPQGKSEPNATLMNFVGGQSQTTTAPLALGAASEAKDLRVKSDASAAMLVIDVQGYYAPQIQASIDAAGAVEDGTARVLSSTRTSTGNYQVTIDRSVTGCVVSSQPNGSGTFIVNGSASGNKVFASAYNTSTGALTNMFWQLTVTC